MGERYTHNPGRAMASQGQGQRGHHRGRMKRPGCGGPAEFFGSHDRLHQAQGRTAELFGYQQAGHALAGQTTGKLLVAALGTAQLVQGLLYNVEAIDPVAFTTVPLLLVGVAALAVYLPARRAASVEPMRALKAD